MISDHHRQETLDFSEKTFDVRNQQVDLKIYESKAKLIMSNHDLRERYQDRIKKSLERKAFMI